MNDFEAALFAVALVGIIIGLIGWSNGNGRDTSNTGGY